MAVRPLPILGAGVTDTATETWRGNEDLRGLLVPVGELRTHPRNPRRGNVDAIRASLSRFGQQRPALALPDGTLVAGNHTFLAAVEEGWTHLAVVRSELTDTEAEAYLAADNRTSDLGIYDGGELAALLAGIEERGSLEGTGYTAQDLEALRAELGRARPAGDPEAVPDVPSAPRSEPGAVYELGPHVLVCGDARSPTVYEPFGGDADLMWTDPPYGVDYTGKTADALKIRGDKAAPLQQLLNDVFSVVPLAAGRPWYVASPAGPMHGTFLRAVEHVNWRLHQTLVWVKDSMVLGHSDYHYQHEPILYGYTPGGGGRPGRGKHAGSRWFGGNAQTTVLAYDRPKRSSEHPTMKPVGLVEQCVRNSSRHGDLVLDPFAGSGSTLIACENLERRAALVELDPAYCDVVRQRYADYVGRPELAP